MQFLTWFSIKKFRYHIKKWLFPIIIAFLGLLLINTMMAVALVGQNIIRVNFLENSNIKLLKVTPDRYTEKISLDFIRRNKNTNVVTFPYMKEINVGLPIQKIGSDMTMPTPGIPLPYEALDIIGIHNIDQAEWEQGNVLIISQEYAEKEGLRVGDEVVLGLEKTEQFENVASAMTAEELQQYVDDLYQTFQARPIKIVQINEVSLIKLKGSGIIPLNLYYQFNAKMANQDVDTFVRTSDSQDGMGVLVKEFEDVEKEANNFKSRNYTVEYSLAEFENLSMIIEYVYYGLLILVLFISVIVMITIVNCIIQLLLFQKREIGILLSMGIPKITIIGSYFYELCLSNVVVIVLQVPCMLLIIYQAQKLLMTLMPNNVEVGMYWPLFRVILVVNVVLLYSITLLGASLPMLKMFRNKINNLIIND